MPFIADSVCVMDTFEERVEREKIPYSGEKFKHKSTATSFSLMTLSGRADYTRTHMHNNKNNYAYKQLTVIGI